MVATTSDRWTIPGDPVSIRAGAAELRARSIRQDRVGALMARIDTQEAWSGPAANRFRASFQEFPKRFQAAADAHARVADALDAYADSLTVAQSTADRARGLYEHGEAATVQAKTDHVRAEQAAWDQARAMGGHVQPIPIPFTDPGASMRAEAVGLFNQAKADAQTAGNAAAHAVTQAGNDAPDRPSMWDNVGQWWSDTWRGTLDAYAGLYEGPLSLLNSTIHHLDDLAMADIAALGTIMNGILNIGAGIISFPARVDSDGNIHPGPTGLAVVTESNLNATQRQFDDNLRKITDDAGGIYRIEADKPWDPNPFDEPGFEGTEYSTNEFLQFIYQHTGEGDMIPSNAIDRPTQQQIADALTKGRRTVVGPGRIEYVYGRIRLYVNTNAPWRSSGWVMTE